MSYSDQVKDADLGNSGYFKFENKGVSKFRVLVEAKLIAQHFFGKGNKPSVCYGEDKGCPFHGENAPKDDKGNEKSPSIKFVTYVLDRADGKIKVADLPYTIIKRVDSWEKDEDYGFSGYPMPYDIKVLYDKDKAPTEMYEVNPAPNRDAVSDDIMGELAGKMAKFPPQAMVDKKKKAQMEAHKAEGVWVSDEERAEKEEERIARFKEDMAANAASNEEIDTIEYPENDLGDPVL